MKNHSNNRCRHFIGLRTQRKTHRWVSERQAVSCSWVSERQESRVRAVLICRVYYSVDVAPVRVLTCVGPVASKYKRFLRFSVPRTPSLHKSTRLWEWNSREKKVSYASGDSSKYFRRLPFLFLPLAGKREKRVGAETEKGDKRVGRWKKKGRVCSFLLFPLANTALGLGRGITKDLSICQFRRSPASKVRRRGHQMHFIMPLLGDASWLRG